MKILRLQSYCYPEVIASTHLVNDLMQGCSESGIIMELHVPSPTRGIDHETQRKYKRIKYEELYGGAIQIHRFPMFRERQNPLLRALRYLLVNLFQYRRCSKATETGVIFGTSTPPTQGVLCGMIKKKLSRKYKHKVPFVYNLQDVFPDSLVTTGMTRKGSLLWKIGRKLEDYTYKSADKIIVISESMKRNIMEKGVPEEKIEVVSNWIDTDVIKPVKKEDNRLYDEFGIDKEKFTVLYAGNFGAAQGADVVLKAARLLPDVQFVIFGGGAEFEHAKSQAQSIPNVIIHGLLPQDRVAEVYSLGDVALITCKKGVGSSGMPSKTWSIMACNTPIIASFDTDSELAEILKQANAGICVEPENAQALADAIRQVAASEKIFSGRDHVLKYASKKQCVDKYVRILKASSVK